MITQTHEATSPHDDSDDLLTRLRAQQQDQSKYIRPDRPEELRRVPELRDAIAAAWAAGDVALLRSMADGEWRPTEGGMSWAESRYLTTNAQRALLSKHVEPTPRTPRHAAPEITSGSGARAARTKEAAPSAIAGTLAVWGEPGHLPADRRLAGSDNAPAQELAVNPRHVQAGNPVDTWGLPPQSQSGRHSGTSWADADVTRTLPRFPGQRTAESDATTVLPDLSDRTAVLPRIPSMRPPEETQVLPTVPRHAADVTTVLPPVQHHAAEVTTVIPAYRPPEADATQILPHVSPDATQVLPPLGAYNPNGLGGRY